jgi:hypothetical protein
MGIGSSQHRLGSVSVADSSELRKQGYSELHRSVNSLNQRDNFVDNCACTVRGIGIRFAS